MVVEDEPNIGALVRTYLERSGYRALWVRTGEEALTELRRHPIKLVVLDIGLPGIDGFEVCRRIGGQVPVIMLTARDEEPERVAGLEAGADDYVSKPFSPRELTARGSERAVGSGLGLAIVKELTTAMGGGAQATSRPGGGAEFTPTVPVPDSAPSG